MGLSRLSARLLAQSFRARRKVGTSGPRKRTSSYQHDEMLDELRRINRRLEKVAKEAAHCDMMATRQFEALR